MPDLRLRGYHEVSGALFRVESGWEVPASYGALDREVDAVRRAAGMVDMSDRAKVRVHGADRVSFLDGLVSADIKVLRPGNSAYALVLDEASRVLGDLRVTAVEDAFVLDIEAAQKDGMLAYLQRQVVSDDVTLEDLGFCGHLEVHGPLAPRVVSAVLGVDVQGLSADEQTAFPLDRHHTGYASRVSTLGESGYVLWAVGDSLEIVWAALFRSGAVPVGRDALEVLRIESGRPRFGVDMSQDTLAIEVAPEGAISLTKGCYRGQEVVARGVSIGQMNRRLVGLRIDGDVPPSHGDRVSVEGEAIGRVTSGCWSPTTGWVVALALLRVDQIVPGTQMFVDHDGWDLRVALHPLPFVLGRP
ncbi:MAG TPA: aminomethyl transferase family protein [Thermoplasmata archaeon]|nr:aminomethyl transferase family protein [Thermoplasmata archaeon]